MNMMRRLKSVTSGRSSVSDPSGEPGTIKRAKVDQELDQRLPGGVETVENRMRDPEQAQ